MENIRVMILLLKGGLTKMETNELLEKAVGTKERKGLEAKPIVVAGFAIEDVHGKKGSKNEGKIVGQKLNVLCKHPDQEEPISLSQIKFIKGTTVTVSTMWINLDEDGNIEKGSPVSVLLEKYNMKNLKALEGKTLATETQSETVNYLCIKAY